MSKFFIGGAAVFGAMIVVGLSPAGAETVEQTAARFAMRPSVLDISLSPSGNKVAYIKPNGDRGEALFVVDLAKGEAPRAILGNSEDNTDLSYCSWASEEYLVCNVYVIMREPGYLLGFDRVISIEAATGKAQILSARSNARALRVSQDGGSVVALDVAGERGKILMTREWVKETAQNTLIANNKEGLGVEEIDVSNGKRKATVLPDKDAVNYIADQYGNVRIKVRHPVDSDGVLVGNRVYYYRSTSGGAWLRIGENGVEGQVGGQFVPVAVDSDRDIAYGFGTKDGYDAIYSVSLAGDGVVKLLAGRSDVDVDHLIRIGRQRRVVGTSYATDRRTIDYLDPELARLSSDLGKALPGQPLVNIIDASSDENRLMIVASSDVDPGMVYLYNKQTRALEELLPLRDRLAADQMVPMKAVSYQAQDGTMIPAYLTLPGGSAGKSLKAIIMPHGGPGARDEWGFDWLVQFFAARGYAVLQPNFRGSTGYGEGWYGKNGFQSWQTAIGDVNDAGRWLVKEGIAAPDKLAIVGWSYGGYAALQSQVLDPNLFKAVVAIAPVTDLERLRNDSLGYTNAKIVSNFIGEGPHVRTGSPAQNIDKFAAPVLLFHGTMDQNVDVEHSRSMKSRLEGGGKAVTYVEFDGLDHQLGEAKARYRMLTESDRFLTQAMAK